MEDCIYITLRFQSRFQKFNNSTNFLIHKQYMFQENVVNCGNDLLIQQENTNLCLELLGQLSGTVTRLIHIFVKLRRARKFLEGPNYVNFKLSQKLRIPIIYLLDINFFPFLYEQCRCASEVIEMFRFQFASEMIVKW